MFDELEPFKPPERSYPSNVPGGRPLRSPYEDPLVRQQTQMTEIGRDLIQLAKATTNNFINLRKIVDAQDDETAGTIIDAVGLRDAELRAHLKFVLVGDSSAGDESKLSSRMVGAVLLGLGILFGTAGSIIGNL